jgi:SsrA-binding protein
MKNIAINRSARRDYEILETFEAGMELKGFEVKAVKTGHINLAGSFAVIKNKEAWLLNANIPPYQPANTPDDYDPDRSRKLLLSAAEIKTLIGRTQEKNLTIVPLKVYLKGRLIKIEIGLGRGKRKADKREAIKKKEWAKLKKVVEAS